MGVESNGSLGGEIVKGFTHGSSRKVFETGGPEKARPRAFG